MINTVFKMKCGALYQITNNMYLLCSVLSLHHYFHASFKLCRFKWCKEIKHVFRFIENIDRGKPITLTRVFKKHFHENIINQMISLICTL